ncbi:RabGAP/TBC [Atractiella rhizophila]|nr:RabGAP/TBC [Atractiella rhizophila]
METTPFPSPPRSPFLPPSAADLPEPESPTPSSPISPISPTSPTSATGAASPPPSVLSKTSPSEPPSLLEKEKARGSTLTLQTSASVEAEVAQSQSQRQSVASTSTSSKEKEKEKEKKPKKQPPSLATAVWRQSLVPAIPSPKSLADITLDSPIRESTSLHSLHEVVEGEEEGGGGDGEYGFITRHARDVEGLKSPVSVEGEGRKLIEEMIAGSGGGGGGGGGGRTGGGMEEVVDWEFWSEVVSDYEQVAKTRPKQLAQAIQSGIPSSLRGLLWQLMSASKDPSLEELYHDLLSQTSSHEKSISRDLARTFPTHPYFSQEGGLGQENLFSLAKAYSLYDEEVGYTQGMQFVAGVLLLNMPDEEAFCVLVRLMKSYDLRSHFVPNMPGLQLRLFQFDRLLEEMCPTVFLHLIRQGIKSSMYASQWLLTLFSYRFPLPLVSIIYDLIFAEGLEAVFRFALSLMKNNEAKLVQLEFEQLLNFLKSGMYEGYRLGDGGGGGSVGANGGANGEDWDTKRFAEDALKVKITPFMLDGFAQEWAEIRDQQNAHAQELANLRAVNGQLSAQVRRLEVNLAQINEEHVKLVKELVLIKLDREGLEEELVKYKLAFADLAHERALADSHRASVASSLNFSSSSR